MKMDSLFFLWKLIHDEPEDAIVAELIRTEGNVRAATTLKETGATIW